MVKGKDMGTGADTGMDSVLEQGVVAETVMGLSILVMGSGMEMDMEMGTGIVIP